MTELASVSLKHRFSIFILLDYFITIGKNKTSKLSNIIHPYFCNFVFFYNLIKVHQKNKSQPFVNIARSSIDLNCLYNEVKN